MESKDKLVTPTILQTESAAAGDLSLEANVS